MYEIEPENVPANFSNNKEIFDFSNYSAKSKGYQNSNALVAGNMKEEVGGGGIKEFARQKSQKCT